MYQSNTLLYNTATKQKVNIVIVALLHKQETIKKKIFNLNYYFQITSLNHKYFRQHIEDAISLGNPVLIEDVLEELDPCLDNILEKNYIKIGNSLKVTLQIIQLNV